MILFDTSIWIDFLKGKEPIYSQAIEIFKFNQCLSTPWIFAELLQGVKSKTEYNKILAFWEQIPKLSSHLVNDVWIEAGILSNHDKGISRGVGIIDYAILMSAKKMNARVWTLDQKLLAITPANQRYSPPF